MHHRAYLSNISPSWPIEDQQKLLAAKMPGWNPKDVYCDVLTPRALRDRDPSKLEWRGRIVAVTSRQEGGAVHVATLAVLAWRQPDFRRVLEALAARGDSLIAHEESRTFDLTDADELEAAVALFPVSRTQSGRRKGSLVGAAASAATRNAKSKAAAQTIKDRWGVPPNTAKALCAEADYDYRTMVRWLGKWTVVAARKKRNADRAAKIAAGITALERQA